MTSYFSSITSSSAISNLSTRLNSIRRAITSGDETDDPENEDCSHISNVLRAYYTEKGRPFPAWLPPDPKAPAPVPTRTIATTQIQPGPYSPVATAQGRGLSDLWGDSGTQPITQTASLRRGRLTPGSAGGGAGAPLAPVRSAPPGSVVTPPSVSPTPTPLTAYPPGTRPLPSQRAGSYQSMSGGVSLERAASAQERLRARLHGGRSPSPAQSGGQPGSPYYGGADPSVRKPVGMPPGRR